MEDDLAGEMQYFDGLDNLNMDEQDPLADGFDLGFADDGNELNIYLPSTSFQTEDAFTRPDQQVILREQEAIRGHRLPIVHAYSHNDLTALQKYPTGFPVGQTDSPGSSGENSHSRNLMPAQQQQSPTKEFTSRLASIPESSATSMGASFGADIMSQQDIKPNVAELQYMTNGNSYNGPSQGMYGDSCSVSGGNMVALAPMENLSVYQCPSGADSPGLLPINDMASWDYSNLEVSPGILASPTCLPGTPSAGPGALLSVDPPTPQSVPQTMPMLETKAFHGTMMPNGQAAKNGGGKPPMGPSAVPQHSGESLGSQGALSSGSSGPPPQLQHTRSIGGMGGGPMYGAPPGRGGPVLQGIPSLKVEPANLRRTQSAVELRTLSSGMGSRRSSTTDLNHIVELTTPEGHTYRVQKLNPEERTQKILRYRQKRHERNFTKRIKYQCRKTLADSRPRVRGRFARNDDAGAVMPHESKKAQKARQMKEQQAAAQAGDVKPRVGNVAGMPGAGHSVVKVQGADSAGGVVRAMPQVVHTIVSQMPPNGVMAQPPHSPHYIQSPHPTTTYIPQHAMYQPPPMSQVPTTYVTTQYATTTGFPGQVQVQQQYAVHAPVQSYPNGMKPGYPSGGQPAYQNGQVYQAGTYQNRQYTMAPCTTGQVVPQVYTQNLVSDVSNGQMYMYHTPMEPQVAYAPPMSHQQQR